MGNPKLSIVVPTRDRAETLACSLRSCLNQTLADYEVVVADNNSSSETKRVVDECGIGQMRYVRSDVSLSMHENWNKAVASARGEYITIIGDDDGLLPNAVAILTQICSKTKADVICWPLGQYFWMNTGQSDTGLEDLLLVPLATHPNSISRPSGHEIMRRFARSGQGIPELPMIYNAAIHRRVIEKITEGGVPFFRSLAPDIYSGMLVAHCIDRFVSLHFPIGIRGTSRFSNYADFLKKVGVRDSKMEFFDLADKDGIAWHPEIPRIPVGSATHFETLFTLRELYPAMREKYPVNDRNMYASFYEGLTAPGLDDAQVDWSLEQLAERGTRVLGARTVEKYVRRARDRAKTVRQPLGFFGNYAAIRASSVGVTEISQACQFVEALLGGDVSNFTGEPHKPSSKELVRSLIPPVMIPILQKCSQRFSR